MSYPIAYYDYWQELRVLSDFPDYSITRGGRVYNNKKKRYLKPQAHPEGYSIIHLMKDSKRYTRYIHRLAAGAFLPNPDNLKMINHLNTIKNDNRVDNLEWCNAKHNVNHAVRSGLFKPRKGDTHPYAKLTYAKANVIRELVASGESQTKLCSMFDISPSVVSSIIKGKAWIK